MALIFFEFLLLFISYFVSKKSIINLPNWLVFAVALIIRLIAFQIFRNSFSIDLASYQWAADGTIDRKATYGILYFPFFSYFGALSVLVTPFIDQYLFIKLTVSIIDSFCALYIARIKNSYSGLLYALCPIPIIVGTIHGQFDAFPALFLLISLELYLSNREIASLILFSVGMFTKTWLLFAVWPYFKHISNKYYIFLIGIVPLISVIFQVSVFGTNPGEVFTNIKNYRGPYGPWGIGAIISLLLPALHENIVRIIRRICLSLIGLSQLFINSKSLAEEIMLCMLALYVLTVNFGAQWLSWVIPLILIVQPKGFKLFIFSASIYLTIIFWQDVYHLYNQNIIDLHQIYGKLASIPVWFSIIRIFIVNYSSKINLDKFEK